MSERPAVRMSLPARPEGVAVVRQALAGMADALAFDPSVLGDMKMAVTEACTNVVVHAYAGQDEGVANDGGLEIDLLSDGLAMTVVVRDHGTGIQTGPQRASAPALGLGLPLIAALSDEHEVRGADGGGTEVRMTFASSRDGVDPVDENPIAETGWRPPDDAL